MSEGKGTVEGVLRKTGGEVDVVETEGGGDFTATVLRAGGLGSSGGELFLAMMMPENLGGFQFYEPFGKVKEKWQCYKNCLKREVVRGL